MLGNIRNNATSFGVKIIFGLIIIVFIFWGVGNIRSSSSSTVAEVNGGAITQQEFAERYNYLVKTENADNPAVTFQNAPEFGLVQVALQELVLEKLTDQICSKLEIFVSGAELKAALAPNPVFHDKHGKFSNEIYENWLAERKILMGKFEADQIKRLRDIKLRTYLGLSVGVTDEEARSLYSFSREERVAEYALFPISQYEGEVNPTPEQVKAFYEANQAAFNRPALLDVSYVHISPAKLAASYEASEDEARAYYESEKEGRFAHKERVKLSQILIKAPAEMEGQEIDAEEVEKARGKALDVLAKVGSGTAFAEAAATYSDDKTSAGNGGEMGWAEVGSMPQILEQAVAGLKKGEVSEPIRTVFGFHLVKVEDRQEAGISSFEDARAEINAALGEKKAVASFDATRQEAEDFIIDAPTLEAVAEKFKLQIENSGQVTEDVLAESLKLPKGSLQAVRDTAAGTIVPVPLDAADGFVIVKVNQYQVAGVAPMEEVAPQIITAIKRQEAASKANEKAAEAIAGFKGHETPESWAGKLVKSEPFRRDQQVPGLSSSQALSSAMFASNPGEWIGNVFSTAEGAVIARVDEIIAVSDAEWEGVAETMKAQLLRNRQEEAYRLFMSELFDKSEITQNPEAIEAVVKHLAEQVTPAPKM